MNKLINKRISAPVLLTLGIVMLFGLFAVPTPAAAQYAVPECNAATLNGYIETNGTTQVWFEWGPGSSIRYSTPKQTFSSNSNFSQRITGLDENSLYSYRAMSSRSTGQTITFTTKSCGGNTPPTNTLPKGYIDGANCTQVEGWSADFDAQNSSVKVEVYKDGPRGVGSFITSLYANLPRPDVNAELNIAGNHAFNFPTPSAFKDTSAHTIYMYGLDVQTGQRVQLNNSGRTIGACNQTPPPTKYQCNDGIDNDGDGKVDYPNDPGCSSPTDDNEHNQSPTVYQCNDGIDNDGDGKVDYPNDPGCSSPTDDNEYNQNQPPAQTCQDPSATNYGGSLPCLYPIAPSVSIQANPTVVAYGQPSYLSWQSNNAVSCNASGSWFGSKGTFGNNVSTGALFSNSVFYITCSNSSGQTATASASVQVSQQQQTCQDPSALNYGGPLPCQYSQGSVNVTIFANPDNIDRGDETTLTWFSSGATSCNASGGWLGSKGLNGDEDVRLYSDTTFYITCTNGQISDTDSVRVTVDDNNNNDDRPDVTTLSATNIERDEARLRGEVDGNGSPTYVWFEYSRNRNDVEDHDAEETSERFMGSGNNNDFSERITGLRSNTTYYFRAVAENNEGIDYGNILSFRTDGTGGSGSVDVNLYVTPSVVNSGQGTTVTWDSDDASYCVAFGGANGWSGSRSTSGTFFTGGLYGSTTFSITCYDSDGDSDNDYATVSVNTVVSSSQPTVGIAADSSTVSYGNATNIRWYTTNATSCSASGGSAGWAGSKSIGPASFYTGSLTASRTYVITCSNAYGTATDSITVSVRTPTTPSPQPTPTSYVVINSAIDRNQPIVPTIDNTQPRPGDEINYTVTYQNVGNASIRNLVLRLNLPFEVDYMFSTPNNPAVSGNTLTFNLGTLGPNAQGTVTVRVRVRDNVPPGTPLNFPAVLTYTDPAGNSQSVSANVYAQVWRDPNLNLNVDNNAGLGAAAFLSGFFPNNVFGWLLLLILILILILLARYLFTGNQPFSKRTTTTTIQH